MEIERFLLSLLSTVLSGFLLERVVECLLECRSCPKKILLLFGCWLQANMVIYFQDWINFIPTIFAFLICVLVACEGSVLKKLTIGLMVASTVFSFNSLNDNFIGFHDWRVVLFKMLFLGAMFLGVRQFAPERGYELSARMWRLLLLLTVTPIGIVSSVVLLGKRYWGMEDGEKLLPLVLLLLALFSFIGLLWTVTVLIGQQKLEWENTVAKINQNYYEPIERQNFEIRRLKHDMANHLTALAALPGEQKDGYIQELLKKPVFTHTLRYCQDPVVNAVLSMKESVMEQKGIQFQVKVDIPAKLPFEKVEICAIFGNVLDNAIEACEKLSEERRKICLEARMRRGIFALNISNPCSCLGVKKQEEFETTKKNKELHGFGLKSIQEMVRNNQGNMEISAKDGQFSLFLYLPLSKEQK